MSMFATTADYERAVAERYATETLAALRDLVEGLDGTYWSSWQTTANFAVQHAAAQNLLARIQEQA